jgi:minor histocompatibility antigen H13
MIIYDLYFVFGSDVMVTVASGIDNPMVFSLPAFWSKWDGLSKSMVGYGDVFVPAIMVSLAIRMDFIAAFNQVKKACHGE